MKKGLLKGVVLISAIALSSCSTTNKLAGTPAAENDDVYYTRAKAGDQVEYAEANTQQGNNNYDDDYYYYGDYASRINRFNYFSPFDYGDTFYYGYTPYYGSRFSMSLELGFGYSPYSYYGYSPWLSSPYGFGAIYSPFDYGYAYSPYYGYGAYDNFGYGGLYSSYLYGGGGGGYRTRQRSRPTYTGGSAIVNRGVRTGTVGSNQGGGYYPGRPTTNGTRTTVNGTTNTNTRAVRPDPTNVRPPVIQQTVDRAPAPSSSSSSGSSNSGSSSSGGGGRPVR